VGDETAGFSDADLPTALPDLPVDLWNEVRGSDKGYRVAVSVNGITVDEPWSVSRFFDWARIVDVVRLPAPGVARIVTRDGTCDLGAGHGPARLFSAHESARIVRQTLLLRALELARQPPAT